MNVASLWDVASAMISAVPRSGLLIATIAAVAAGWIGSNLASRDIAIGRTMSRVSTVLLGGILVLVVLQLSRLDPQLEFAVPELGLPQQVVEGGETRIPLAPDGHFWLRVSVNGTPANFMIDTGATITAVSARAAQRAGIEPRRGGIPITLSTANGTISAQVATVDELRFGNVAARGLDVVMAPEMGETNVIGMNVLSRLKSWRVENNVLILVPHHPQPIAETGAND